MKEPVTTDKTLPPLNASVYPPTAARDTNFAMTSLSLKFTT